MKRIPAVAVTRPFGGEAELEIRQFQRAQPAFSVGGVEVVARRQRADADADSGMRLAQVAALVIDDVPVFRFLRVLALVFRQQLLGEGIVVERGASGGFENVRRAPRT